MKATIGYGPASTPVRISKRQNCHKILVITYKRVKRNLFPYNFALHVRNSSQRQKGGKKKRGYYLMFCILK